MENDDTNFDQFWEASSLDRFNLPQFANQLNSYDSDNKELLMEYPDAPLPLYKPLSRLNKIARERRSCRTFSDKQLSLKELGLILSSFYGWGGLEHRSYASAGASYVTEIYGVAFNVEDLSGKIIYYDPEKHGVVSVAGDAPTWQESRGSLNVSVEGEPSLILVLVTFPKRAMAKYGERGGRFALLEAGAAMQQASLQIAGSNKLKGVVIGGMIDNTWKRILQLDNTDAHVTIGYLIGK